MNQNLVMNENSIEKGIYIINTFYTDVIDFS